MADNQFEVNEQRFRTFFNSLKEGVACIDFQGNVMHCNPAYCHMLGYSEAELVGRRVVDLIIPANKRDEFYSRLEARKKGQEEDYETEVFKKNGDKIWINIKSRNIFDDDGIPYAYLVSVNDITDEKRKVEDLEAFTGSAAHDLRAPLARISSLVSLFDTENISEEQKLYLSMIEETSVAMRQLLQDLLTFSRLGATQLEKTQLDLNEIVKEVCAEQTPSDFNGEIIIGQLPPTYGNESAIRQLFTNLISNAIKYSSKKEKSRIEIAAYAKDKVAVYFIKDNGVGLSSDQISNLFTPFKRFHSDFEGNGLGLAIVKRVIEKHSGSIWVESEMNNGLVFNFTLTPDLGTV
jgi:PAS domain S-box-containing protein